MASTIRELMTSNPVTMPQDRGAGDAAQAMRDKDIGDVIVLDDSEQICGIVTDRDLVVRVMADGKDAATTQLGEICSRSVATLTPDDSVGDAVRLMSERAIRRAPVVENGRAVGIVSLGDLAMVQDPDSALADISEAQPNG